MKKDENGAPIRGMEAELWMESLWQEIINKISQEKSKEIVGQILEKLISESEKKTILKRLGVLALIKSGKSYKEISEILWLSPNTISTIKKNVFDTNKNYKSYLAFYGGPRKYSEISKMENKKSLLGGLFSDIDLWDLLINPPRPQGIGLIDSKGVPKRRRK
ncbi:MAG: Trp family transcriptional regulator [Patescibacteria group bacterium]